MNIWRGFCPCLDCQQNGLCAHLMAAELQFGSEHGESFQWSSSILAPADPNATIAVQRWIAAPRLPAGVPEPTESCDAGQLVRQLAAAATASRSRPPCGKQLTECQKELSSLGSSLVRAAGQLPDDVLRQQLPHLQQLVNRLGQHIPGFKKVRANPAGRGRRQDKDRKEKPLYAGRTRSKRKRVAEPDTGAAEDSGEAGVQRKRSRRTQQQQPKKQQQRLKRLPEAGRRRSKYRGLGNFDRGPTRKAGGGMRRPRYNPYKANWGTGMFVKVGAGLQLAAPQQQASQQATQLGEGETATQPQQQQQRKKLQKAGKQKGRRQQGEDTAAEMQQQQRMAQGSSQHMPTRGASKRKAAQACAAFMQDYADADALSE